MNPTLVNGVAGSGDASQNVCKTEKPKLPSRPPNTKLNKKGHRGRSLSVGDECFSQMVSGFTRSKSVSSQSRALAKRYNKIMELHLQTLQVRIFPCKGSISLRHLCILLVKNL